MPYPQHTDKENEQHEPRAPQGLQHLALIRRSYPGDDFDVGDCQRFLQLCRQSRFPDSSPAPAPSTEQPVSEMTVPTAGGTCTTDNLSLQAGKITVNLNTTDQSKDLYALTVYNLDQDKDFVDLMTSTSGMPPSWADILSMEELEPGLSKTYTFTVEKGPIYVICWSKPPDLPIGNAGPIEVKP